MTTHEYAYPARSLANGDLAVPSYGSPSLRDLVRPVLAGRRYNLGTSPTQLHLRLRDEPALTQAEEAAVSAAVAAWDPDSVDLDAEKAAKIAQVNKHVEARLRPGFLYNGKRLSLSRSAQINWLGLAAKASRLSYPYTIRTIDDLDTYEIANEADALALSDAAFDAVEIVLRASRVVRTNVLAAGDVAAIEAAATSWLAGGDP